LLNNAIQLLAKPFM